MAKLPEKVPTNFNYITNMEYDIKTIETIAWRYFRESTSYSYQSSNTRYLISGAERAIKAGEKQLSLIEEAHQRNLPVIEANKEAAEKVKALMTEVGMPPTYKFTDPKSRARYPKAVTKSAGYIDDLVREFPTVDSYELYKDRQVKWIDSMRKGKEQLEHRLEIEIKNASKALEEENQLKKEQFELNTFAARYGLDHTATWEDILEAILKKSPILNMAHAMLMTRNDWTDGFYRVEYALTSDFVDALPDAAKSIQDVLRGDDNDGRVFRDMEHGYGALFAIVDNQLYEDYTKASEKAEEEW